jgi:predicted GIY-YIG superfamily endonuclease
MGEWSVYLIRAAGDVLYTGIATDVDRRIEEHRTGRGSKYLRGRGPLVLVYRRRRSRFCSADAPTRRDARSAGQALGRDH